MSAPVLITGGAGFIGSNVADRLAGEGRDVLVLDSLAREGVRRNLDWLRSRHPRRITSVIADVRDADAVTRAVDEAGAVFHFAAQVAVTTSLDDPQGDCAVNILGTLNVLEAIRRREKPIPLIFASTNKVYGDLSDVALHRGPEGYLPADAAMMAHGVPESRPLDFHTPYGVSKGAADQYVLDYARSYGIPAAVLRMSCIYGQRQMGTEDQGWVAHFLIRAIAGEPITIYGDGDQVRDVLDVSDAANAYLALLARIDRLKGHAFNLGGGPDNAISLRTLIGFIGDHLGRPVEMRTAHWRAGDQRYFVADARKALTALGLGARVPWRAGVARLAHWLEEQRGLAEPPAATVRGPSLAIAS